MESSENLKILSDFYYACVYGNATETVNPYEKLVGELYNDHYLLHNSQVLSTSLTSCKYLSYIHIPLE